MAKRQIDKLITDIDAEITALQDEVNAKLAVLHATRVRFVKQREEQDAKRKPKRKPKNPDVQTRPMHDSAGYPHPEQ